MTNAQKISGHVDQNHQLVAIVPDSVPPGPVTVFIVARCEEDEAGSAWQNGIANQWQEELSDERQDIYTLGDGEPVDES